MMLYKYQSPRRVSTLNQGMIRFTQPRWLNDSEYECRPVINSLIESEHVESIIEGMDEKQIFAFASMEITIGQESSMMSSQEYLEYLIELSGKANDLSDDNSLSELVGRLEMMRAQDDYKLGKSATRNVLLALASAASRNDTILSYMKRLAGKYIVELSKSSQSLAEERLHQRLNESFGVYCVSSSPNISSMWARYADSGSGFLIGYDTDFPLFKHRHSQNENLGRFHEVAYSNEVPALDVYRDALEISKNDAASLSFLKKIMLTKSSQWQSESEWRMIQLLEEAEKVVTKENGEKIYLFEINGEAVRDVVIGYSAVPDIHDEIVDVARKKYPHARIMRAIPVRDRFLIDIHSL